VKFGISKVIVFLVFANLTYAAEICEVSGRVVDESGKPVADADVAQRRS
jgi:hypothetical protein